MSAYSRTKSPALGAGKKPYDARSSALVSWPYVMNTSSPSAYRQMERISKRAEESKPSASSCVTDHGSPLRACAFARGERVSVVRHALRVVVRLLVVGASLRGERGLQHGVGVSRLRG